MYTLITFYLALILQAVLKVTWIRKAMSEIIKKIVIENRKGNGQNAWKSHNYRTKKHQFSTNLAFQQRDLALEISFHSEIVTKGSPPKCFKLMASYFFFLCALEQEAIMIHCWLSKRWWKERMSPVPRNAHWERYKMADKSSLNNVSVRI